MSYVFAIFAVYVCVGGGGGCSNVILEAQQLFYSAESYYYSWVRPDVFWVALVLVPVCLCVSLALRRQTSPPLTHPFNCFKHLVKASVTSPNQGLSKHHVKGNKMKNNNK